MQVNAYRPNQNQVSFSSIKISPTVVRDLKGLPVKAWFSKLSLSDPLDAKVMKRVNDFWKEEKGIYFANDIYEKFKAGQPVYALELDSPEGSLYDKLLGLASPHIQNDTFVLDFLQSSPNSSFEAAKKNRKFKGAGTALMYGLVKIAEQEKAKLFKLCSGAANAFYKTLGMKKENNLMTFNQSEMGDFLKRQKTEFDLLLQKQPAKTDGMALKCS